MKTNKHKYMKETSKLKQSSVSFQNVVHYKVRPLAVFCGGVTAAVWLDICTEIYTARPAHS